MKRLTFFLGLSLLLTISSAQAEDNPTLAIFDVKGTSGIIEIHYRVEDATGDRLVTTDWQFSTDDGATWTNIDEAAIGNNDPKPPREDFITWDTTKSPALSAAYYTRVRFRMRVWTTDIGSWRVVAPMLTARSGLAAAALNGKIYAIGGYNGNFLNTVEEYTPETNSWRAP